jgi:aryl-alcohol dehydrogenase-like predicted oxidoreductase
MKYRRLGRTEMTVSVVGIGTWQFGGEWGKDFEQAEVDAMFAKATELGVNFIDTAECYGDHTSEEFIGRAIEGKRGDWIIATKFGHKFHDKFDRTVHYEPDHVRGQIEASLKALRTDHVDLLQFHSGDNDCFVTDGLWEMLAEQVEAGKVRHLGISISPNDNVWQTDRAGQVNAETIQVVYNRLDRKPEEDVFPSCIRQDLGVLARVPLASGYLSGKYDTSSRFSQTDVRGRWHGDEQRRETLQEVERLKGEVPEGATMAQWALAWCLQHPALTCVIPGCKTPEQVEANAQAAELEMVRDDHPQAVQKSV